MKRELLTIISILIGLSIRAQIITTIAGNGIEYRGNEDNGDGGIATKAKLNNPWCVILDSVGNLYIAEHSSNRIRKVTISSGIITTIAGNGKEGYSGDGGLAINGELKGPSSMVLDGMGNLYISESGSSRIRKVNASSGIITTVAGNGKNVSNSNEGDGVKAINTQLHSPRSITIDKQGNLFIADTYGSRVRKINGDTGIINTVAGGGDKYLIDGVAATSVELSDQVTSIALDNKGNLYISDFGHNRVRKVNLKTGKISTIAGSSNYGYSGDGGSSKLAKLNEVDGITLDSYGNLYISDSKNNRIRKVNSITGIITTIVGNGKGARTGLAVNIKQGTINSTTNNNSIADYTGDGGLAKLAGINTPTSLALDNKGNLYFIDYGNNVIRKVTNVVSNK